MRGIVTALVIGVAGSSLVWGGDWTQFRGPGGLGRSGDADVPLKWSPTENVVWKTELPGLGSSSPIILGDRVFLTCYTGYGLSESDPGDMENLARHVVCVKRADGKIVWTKEYKSDGRESNYSGNGARHGYSSSTPATDGERLYVFFGKAGVFAFDLDGNELWQANVGSDVAGWGSSNSPVLFKNLVIINASIESKSLVALDNATGKEVWRAERIQRSWNTPVLVDVPGGQTELVVSITDWLLGFDPETGNELWRAEGIHDYVCPSVVANESVVYAIGARQNTATAVKAGGRGDVTETHVAWRTNKGSNVSSPVYHDGHLYWVHEGQGTAICLNAATGDVVFQERLQPRPGTVYSSVLLAGDRLYAVSQRSGTFVIAAKPQFELLGVNTLDDARANAVPAVSDGKLFLRNDKFLYCLGK
jgi:outer membrane protein assembly factor BamB